MAGNLGTVSAAATTVASDVTENELVTLTLEQLLDADFLQQRNPKQQRAGPKLPHTSSSSKRKQRQVFNNVSDATDDSNDEDSISWLQATVKEVRAE
jgi:hypothetical protein